MLWWNNPEPAKAQYKTVEVPPVIGSSDVLGRNSGISSVIAGLKGPTSMSKMLETMIGEQSPSPSNTLMESVRRSVSAALGPRTRRELVKPAETVIDHLVRLTWLEEAGPGESPGLRLSDVGRALLRDCEQESTIREDVSVVVFEVEDPLAYPLLVGQLANAGNGLLVDPYLKLDDLHRIVVSTNLTRLLISGVRQNQREVAAMQTYLDSPSLARPVEVRSSTELHDRVLIATDGSVLTLGTSLNGVGRKLTVLSPIPPNQNGVFRDTYEKIWDNATLVGPQPVEDEHDAGEAGDEVQSETDQSHAQQANQTETTNDDNTA